MTDRGSKKVVIQKMTAMFSCAHRACMVVYSTAACNTCHPRIGFKRKLITAQMLHLGNSHKKLAKLAYQ